MLCEVWPQERPIPGLLGFQADLIFVIIIIIIFVKAKVGALSYIDRADAESKFQYKRKVKDLCAHGIDPESKFQYEQKVEDLCAHGIDLTDD